MNDEEITQLKQMAKDINQVLIQLMNEMSLRLVDFKVEFGKTNSGKILLADEISPTLAEYGIKIRILTLIKMYIETTLARLLKLIKHFK